MKRLVSLVLALILSLTLCFSAVTVNAEEFFDIIEVTEEELTVIEEEAEFFDATAADAVCYIGEDEASRVYYATLVDAVKATNNSSVKTIHLTKNATWEGYTYESGYGVHHKHFILEGHGYTLTLNQQIHVSLNSDFTFNDVTVNLASSYAILIGCNGKLTLGDKTTVTGRTTDGYAVGTENRNGDGGTFTMLPGSKLTGNTANVLGVVYAGCKSTIIIEGEITGNTSGAGAIRVNNSNVKITVGKNANITGNSSKNIAITAANQLTIASDFVGTIGVSYGSAGASIGTIEEGADVSGITLDGTATVATNKDGVLTWETADEAAARNMVCYINENAEGKRYASLNEAINAATTGSTIYVTKNVTLDITANATYGYKNLTIKSDGAKKTVTVTGGSVIFKGDGSVTTLENIAFDFAFSGKNFRVDDGATVKLVGADILNGKGGVGGTVAIGSGMNGHLVMDENSTISGRSTESAEVGGVVHLHGGSGMSTFTMNGGTIINYNTARYAVAPWNNNSTITIGGNAKIINGTSSEATPVTGTRNAILLKNANQLTVKSDFVGEINVKYGSAGSAFGTVEEGAKVSGIKLYGTETVATNKNGVLTWETEAEAADKNSVCYIDENVAGKRYNSLHDAVAAATSGSTIFVKKDITWDNVTTYHNKNITIKSADSAKKKITMPSTANLKITGENGKVTFENVTLDFNFNGKNLQIDDGATVYLVGADVLNGRGGVGGTVILGAGTSGHLVMDANSTISGRSTESTANIGGVVHLHATSGMSSFTMNGGTIINYNTNLYAVSPWTERCTITIGGNAKIINGVSSEATPVTGTKDAINLRWNSVLKVKGDFTGDIKVNYGSLGDKIGTAEAGATISGNLTNFSKGTPAVIKNGDVIWDYACYVGTDTAANRYYTVGEALKGTKTSKVYMVKDALWEPSLDANTGTYANAKLTVNGNGYTLTPSKSMRMAYNTDIVFEDVTVDMDGKTFTITDGAKVTLNDGAHFINGGSDYGQGGTFATWSGHNITITMNPGSSITGSKAEYGGAMVLNNGSKFIMNGGEISGNQATVGKFGGGVKANAGAKITISGNAKIEGNKSGADFASGMDDNLMLESADILTINPGFTGHIAIWYEANADQGEAVGKAGEGLTKVPSVGSITNDYSNALFGWINADGNIIWQAKPVITPTLQYGTYAEGQKGIIRFTNTFTSAPATAKITGVGTYILDNTSFSETDLAETDNKFVKTEISVLALNKGFITDLHTGNLAKSYTVSSFCYIEGVEAPVFVTTAAEAINSVENVIELSDSTVASYEAMYEN